MEKHLNISLRDRDDIINGSVNVVTQIFRNIINGDYSHSCFHLDRGQIEEYTNEGVQIVFGEYVGQIENDNEVLVDLTIIRRWNT